ncbi:MAG: selenide, water dikinase SelD [Candidatus Sumerlaeia bacterium]
MARSKKLGHCICQPAKNCPCDTLINHNVCPCAGERMPAGAATVALTKTVRRAGCASKIGQGDLKRILSALPEINDENVLVGAAAGDDAGIYKLNDTQALVQTVDVFAPVVDDPYLFGQIAAANSLSDVYAMGGRPLTALSIVGFPIEELDGSIMQSILAGGIDKLNEAGCALVGGHSINDVETKCGFAITGLVDIKRVVERGRARPGDALVLTKPLGTGMIAFGAQIGRIRPEWLDIVGRSMATLNRDAAELMTKHNANACTDVTGFGLAGHLVEMARTSGVSAEIELEKLPVFAAAEACLRDEILSGAIERNQEYAMAWVHPAPDVPAWALPILYDPQTSGGLLVSLPAGRAEAYVADMLARGHAATTVIGRVCGSPSEIKLTVIGKELKNLIESQEKVFMEIKNQPAAQADEPCCANPPAVDDDDAAPALAQFQEFMKAASKPGLVDRRAKKLMAIALSIAARCEPCLVSHLKTGRAMGLTQAEIDEAAALAVSFGGCSAFMFYKTILNSIKE